MKIRFLALLIVCLPLDVRKLLGRGDLVAVGLWC